MQDLLLLVTKLHINTSPTHVVRPNPKRKDPKRKTGCGRPGRPRPVFCRHCGPQCLQKTTNHKQLSPAQQQAIIRRRTKKADKFCPFPGCGESFTTNERYKSKYPSPISFIDFFLIPQLAAHYKGRHLGIKDYLCEWPGCPYKTTHQSDLVRHSKIHEART